MLKGCPCKVVDISSSKTGKHGHAKAAIVGIDIFTGQKKEDGGPTSHNIDCPVVTRKDYQFISIDESDVVTYMDGEDYPELKLDEGEEFREVRERIKKADADEIPILVTIISAMGEMKIVGMREDKS